MTDREMSYGSRGSSGEKKLFPDQPAGSTTGYGETGSSDSGEQSDGSGSQQVMQKAQEKASEFGQKAQEQADMGLDKAAGTVDRAATQLRERAQQQGGVQAEVGTKVADGLDKTAGYLQEHDTAEIMDDVERYVREHPLQAMAGAVVGGFVLARILR